MAGRVAYYGNIVKDGLVLDLDAAKRDSYPGSGTTWSDVSGFQNNGTLVNGSTFNSSNGGSITFDGVDDYVTVSPPLTGITDFTLFTWFKTPSIATEQFLYDCGYVTTGWVLEIYQSKLSYQVGNTYLQSTTTLSSNQTYCGVISKAIGSSGSFYVNGVSAGPTIPNNSNIPNADIKMGIALSPTRYPFSGNLYSTQLYNRALSAAEVTQNFNALRGRYGI